MPPSSEDLERRIRDAKARDQAQRAPSPSRGITGGGDTGAARLAFRIGVEFVSAVIVGGFLGYWIDRWLGTMPFGMIIMFFLGSIAGFVNVYRAAMGQEYKVGFKPDAGTKAEAEAGPEIEAKAKAKAETGSKDDRGQST